jgi:alpha-glucuronidase
MKVSILICFLFFIVSGLKAEDGHSLWLRNNYASPVNVVGTHKSLIFDVAKQELHDNWQGKENATINLIVKKDKRIKGDGFILSGDNI